MKKRTAKEANVRRPSKGLARRFRQPDSASQADRGDWREQMIRVLRVRKYSYRTEQTYLEWMQRFARFVGERSPSDCGVEEVKAYLNDLAVLGRVSASTQRQALNSIVFYYQQVLEREGSRGFLGVSPGPGANQFADVPDPG